MQKFSALQSATTLQNPLLPDSLNVSLLVVFCLYGLSRRMEDTGYPHLFLKLQCFLEGSLFRCTALSVRGDWESMQRVGHLPPAHFVCGMLELYWGAGGRREVGGYRRIAHSKAACRVTMRPLFSWFCVCISCLLI